MSDHILPSTEAFPATNPTTRFERKDINLRSILLVGAGLVALAVVVHLVGWWMFDALQARDRATKVSPFPLAAEERGKLPKEPRLEQVERMEQAKYGKPSNTLYREEQQRLESYGWVDEKAQVAHIPIDRAMKLLIEQQRLRSLPEGNKADK